MFMYRILHFPLVRPLLEKGKHAEKPLWKLVIQNGLTVMHLHIPPNQDTVQSPDISLPVPDFFSSSAFIDSMIPCRSGIPFSSAICLKDPQTGSPQRMHTMPYSLSGLISSGWRSTISSMSVSSPILRFARIRALLCRMRPQVISEMVTIFPFGQPRTLSSLFFI